MSGRPGRSGGHNRLSDEQHRLRGTRPRRASLRPLSAPPSAWSGLLPNGAAAPAAPPPWTPAPEDVAALGEAGRHFLEHVLEQFAIDLMQGTLLLEAAHVLDGLTAWRSQAQTDPQSARLALAHTKTLAALIAQLGLG